MRPIAKGMVGQGHHERERQSRHIPKNERLSGFSLLAFVADHGFSDAMACCIVPSGCLIGVMVFSFARVSAVIGMSVEDYYPARKTVVAAAA